MIKHNYIKTTRKIKLDLHCVRKRIVFPLGKKIWMFTRTFNTSRYSCTHLYHVQFWQIKIVYKRRFISQIRIAQTKCIRPCLDFEPPNPPTFNYHQQSSRNCANPRLSNYSGYNSYFCECYVRWWLMELSLYITDKQCCNNFILRFILNLNNGWNNFLAI